MVFWILTVPLNLKAYHAGHHIGLNYQAGPESCSAARYDCRKYSGEMHRRKKVATNR
jgi:hypothetical protein